MRSRYTHQWSGWLGGQIAVLFLPLMAFLFVLVLVTVNVGQMAQVRVETSNSADAGALAGASWMASGQNEAAWVARKMWDTIWMTQALYLVPLCAGPDRKAYADRVWNSLAARHGAGGSCSRDHLAACGPSSYFHHIADAAMEGAWHVGAREYITASTNNLLIRSALGTNNPCLFSCYDYGNVPKTIHDMQIYDYNSPDSPLLGSGIQWSNGLATSDPQYRQHDAEPTLFTYPQQPPTLLVQGKNTVYAQYKDSVPAGSDPAFPYYACRFDGMATGIQNTGTNPSPVPEANLPNTLPAQPLTIVPSGSMMGYKAWDMDLQNVIPAITALRVGSCSDVCGMATGTTPSLPLRPSSIQGGDGQVEAHTLHVVTSNMTVIPTPPFFSFTNKFKPVMSEAIATFTSADVTSGSIPDVPKRTAKAQLQSTQ